VDGGQLHRLGRRLIELSAQVTGENGEACDVTLTPAEAAVLEDVVKHQGSSISDIRRRTGFVQSHVSASVANLRARRLVETATDPGDARRTRVRVADDVTRVIMRRAARQADEAIANAVGNANQAGQAIAMLETLADLLL
jgi:DNA-binding MarR family transcriptional regulator